MNQLTVVLFFLVVLQCSQALPQNLKKCKVDDSECLIAAANYYLFNSQKEHAELKLPVPSIDPLPIKKMDISQSGNQSVTIDLKLRDVFLHGLTKGKIYKVNGFKANPEGNKIEISSKSPLVSLKGPYQITGRMLILPIQGKGTIHLDLENIDYTLKFLTKKVVRNGKTYMEMEKAKFNFTITKAQVNFSNLFNGDKVLGDNMNFFLNQNWNIVIDELKKPINLAFANEFKNIVNGVFTSIPYDELFIL